MMYRMLRVMFQCNRNQAIPGATGGSPFYAHQEQNLMVPVTKRSLSKPKLAEISRVQATQFENAVDRLEDTIERFNVMTDRKEKNGSYHPNDCSCRRKCPPFKPTITRCQHGCFSRSAPHPTEGNSFPNATSAIGSNMVIHVHITMLVEDHFPDSSNMIVHHVTESHE